MRKLALLACGLALSGCASVTRGWEEVVHFSSLPTEAALRTSTGFQCITPCIMKVQRKEDFTATFSKPGYISVDVPVRGQVGGSGGAGFAGNLLVGGVVGWWGRCRKRGRARSLPQPGQRHTAPGR
jgi:hypothetical protein